MQRFFIPPDWIKNNAVTIRGRLVHQLRNVLRMGAGDWVVLLDDSGWEYQVELTKLSGQHIEGVVKNRCLSSGEPGVKITLYQALLKGRSFELVLQKGTELGVVGFVPMVCERCVAGAVAAWGSKLDRWQKIIAEAAEQSRRGRLPLLHPVTPFHEACRSVSGLSLLPWEQEQTIGLRALVHAHAVAPGLIPFSINLFIGPEGGFSPSEVEFAGSLGILPVSLGPRVLRAETAGLVAAAAILYECGDLGG